MLIDRNRFHFEIISHFCHRHHYHHRSHRQTPLANNYERKKKELPKAILTYSVLFLAVVE